MIFLKRIKVSCIHLLLQSRPEADSRRVSAKSKFKVKEGSDGVSLIFAASSCWSVPVLHVMSSKTPARIEGQLDTAGSKLYFCPMYRTKLQKERWCESGTSLCLKRFYCRHCSAVFSTSQCVWSAALICEAQFRRGQLNSILQLKDDWIWSLHKRRKYHPVD